MPEEYDADAAHWQAMLAAREQVNTIISAALHDAVDLDVTMVGDVFHVKYGEFTFHFGLDKAHVSFRDAADREAFNNMMRNR